MGVRRVELSRDLEPGQLWWARPDPSVGREESGRRPVLVLAGREFLRTVDTLVMVAPLTTVDRGWPNHVAVGEVEGLPRHSLVMTEQVRTISRRRLDGWIGDVDERCLAEARRWVVDYLSG